MRYFGAIGYAKARPAVIGGEDWALLHEAAQDHDGDIAVRVAGGGLTEQDERRCWRMSILAGEGLFDQRSGSGPFILWRLTQQGRTLTGPGPLSERF